MGCVRTRVILLRAVNVGGATLPMADLRQIMAELGAENVRTYIASGNAVCDLDGDPDAFDRALESAIEKRFGYFRESISRTPEELVAALAAHPFEVIEPKCSYVTFLTATPTAAAIEKARGYETGDDVWEIIGRDQHTRFAGGGGTPQMKTVAIAKALGVPGTARNLNTVRALIALARA